MGKERQENDGRDSEVLPQLQAELDSVDPSFMQAKRLLEEEITRVKSGKSSREPKKFIEVHNMTPVKMSVYIVLPTKEHPKFNFVGKLLGPGGTSLKRMQSETQTRMAIQGRASMKDKRKEEELRQEGGAKYGHLSDDLHLKIDAFAPAEECYSRLANAIGMVKPFLIPEANDEISQTQMTQLRGPDDAYPNGGGRRGGMMEPAPRGGGDGYYGGGRDMAPPPSRLASYDDYPAPAPRSRDPYGSRAPPDAYDRPEPRAPARDSYYDTYSQPAAEPSHDRYSEYGQSRQSSWGSQGNGYQGGSSYSATGGGSAGGGYSGGGGYGKAPARGARTAAPERSHPYTRGGGRGGGGY